MFASAQDFSGSTSLTMLTDDQGNTGIGGAQTDEDSSTITVSATNDAPVNTVPPAVSTPTDTPVAVTGISVADVDAGPATVFVVLSATHGTLNLSTSFTGGVMASEVTGNGSAAVVVQSTLAKINATLAGQDGLVFTPAAGFAGTAAVTLVSNDQGNTGSAARSPTWTP